MFDYVSVYFVQAGENHFLYTTIKVDQ